MGGEVGVGGVCELGLCVVCGAWRGGLWVVPARKDSVSVFAGQGFLPVRGVGLAAACGASVLFGEVVEWYGVEGCFRDAFGAVGDCGDGCLADEAGEGSDAAGGALVEVGGVGWKGAGFVVGEVEGVLDVGDDVVERFAFAAAGGEGAAVDERGPSGELRTPRVSWGCGGGGWVSLVSDSFLAW